MKCQITYCENEGTQAFYAKVSPSLPPIKMNLCPEHMSLFLVRELEAEANKK